MSERYEKLAVINGEDQRFSVTTDIAASEHVIITTIEQEEAIVATLQGKLTVHDDRVTALKAL